MNEVTIKSTIRVFNGTLYRISHNSLYTKTIMTFAIYIPDNETNKTPLLLYLSGLTCTDENVCQKSGIFKYLSDYKLSFLAPDTSPRGIELPGDRDSWDFGIGAGFYLDALESPWNNHYNMYSYIVKELLPLIAENYPTIDTTRCSITGHSMGGHGALTIALKNPNLFRSVSAFAPIANPINCPWGKKAFNGYLGSNEEYWKQYDATELMLSINQKLPFDDILIDVGTADTFYQQKQLLPEDGYDHSYYFISTFIENHIKFHYERLIL